MKEDNLESGKTIEEHAIDENKVQEIKKEMQKALDMDLMEKVLQNNAFEFEHEEIKYRVKKPTFEQKQDTNTRRIKKHMELLKHPDFVLEEELRRIYKIKGVDINKIDEQMLALEKKKESYYLKLGQAIKEKKAKNEWEIYKKEIQDIQGQQQELSIRKTSYLELSIEHQVTIFVYSYLTYLISEKLDGDKWISVWNSYEDFIREDSNKINKITFYASLIISEILNQK